MQRNTLAAGAVAIAMMVPALALAQTASTTPGVPSDVQGQIQSLLSQIQALQQQLHALLASSSQPLLSGMQQLMASTSLSFPGGDHGPKVPCVPIARNLQIGAQGDDVRELQDMLAQDPENGFIASSTGVFGPMTAQAMMKFQMRMGISSSSSGFVGPHTRAFFQEHCGGGHDRGWGNSGMNNGNVTPGGTTTSSGMMMPPMPQQGTVNASSTGALPPLPPMPNMRTLMQMFNPFTPGGGPNQQNQ